MRFGPSSLHKAYEVARHGFGNLGILAAKDDLKWLETSFFLAFGFDGWEWTAYV